MVQNFLLQLNIDFIFLSNRLAEVELLKEAKRAAVRHSIAGPSGWQPCPKANKSFLVNTLLQTMSSNRIHSKKAAQQREKRLGKFIEKKERKLKQKNSNNNFIYKSSKTRQEIEKETVLVKSLKKLKSHQSRSEKDKVKKKHKKEKKKKH